MMPDDISLAFHQLFYHPHMMPVFASVFSIYLCIPAGTIFGGCTSPSFYMLLSELHAWLAGAFNFQGVSTHLMDTTLLPPELTPAESCLISPVFQDSFNLGAMNMLAHGSSTLYPVFMDDTGNANIRSRITATITALVLVTYIVFGFLGNNPWANCPPCINKNKWTAQLTHLVTFLGFHIDTQSMTVTWPFAK